MTPCGLNTTYQKGCRCSECTAAHRASQVAYRRKQGMVPINAKPFKHGEYGYRKRKCRCAVCCKWKEKNNERRRELYRKRHQPKPVIPTDPARFERICRYAETLRIPLWYATKLVDRMGIQ